MTKHEKIIEYITQLKVGHKISVRQIAKALDVSDGTAYRAIKDAEVKGLVSTVERVGTVRIETKDRSDIEKLTFAEVVNIVDGRLIGGDGGLQKTLSRFVIGAMKLEDMMQYVESGSLLIVGNRDQAHLISLQRGAAVLITGGFEPTQEVRELADELNLPVISTIYDTFTVATLIHRAIDDRLIKKEILLVKDVLSTEHAPCFVYAEDTVEAFHQLVQKTGHSRYPVLDKKHRLIGMVTTKDVIGLSLQDTIDQCMSRKTISVKANTSLASVAHEMIWEGIELVPVVDEEKHLLGVVSRQDVIRSLQYMQKQPQVGETIQELSLKGFKEQESDAEGWILDGFVTPQMTDSLGVLSAGVCISLITESALRALRRIRRDDLVVQNVTFYHLKPIQLESSVTVRAKVLDLSRKSAKVEVEVFCQQQVMAKALLTTSTIDR